MAKTEDIIGRIEAMYNSYADNIYYFLLSRLRSKEDAEEVLQSVFLKLVGIKERVLAIKEPRAYLFTVARNEAVNFALAGKHRRSDAALDELWFEPADKAVNTEEARLLELAVKGLPDDQSTVVILKAYQGFTFEEIGEAMGIPVNTAVSKYRYALSNLKKVLNPQGE